ncbi:MAG: protein kinase, partial [Planctomycetes bacterium]|nr:protein kinase [Planctomycetota bacterium]
MPDPVKPVKVPGSRLSSSVTQSSVQSDAEGFRAGETEEDEVDLRSVLAPAQGQGEIGRLERYRILKELGHGGMGLVLLGEDANLRRMAAIKVMLPKFARVSSARERFLREARAAAKLNHDNVVRIYQVDEVNGIPFIAMEFLKGTPLDQYLKEKGELPLSMTVRIGREIAEGLQAAHVEGLIHRDIKPANIWLEAPKARVKILDFGLAREEKDDSHITKSGAVVGTPAFMSPEQAYGKPLDHRSDLFSLGVVLYRLCTGRQPFNGASTMAVLMALGTETPTPASQVNPNVPADLERLINRLLAKDRERRPASAEEVAEALEAIEKPANAGVPEMAYMAPTPTVVDNPFADIDSSQTEIPVAMPAPRKQPSAVRPRTSGKSEIRKPVKSKSKMWMTLALGAIVLLAGGFFLVNKMSKGKTEGESKATEGPNKKPIEPKSVVVANSPALLRAPFTKEQADKARTDWAAYLNIPERLQLELPKGATLEVVLIPPGRFRMGVLGNKINNNLPEITITKPFYMATTETTQEQYEAVTGSNPSTFSAKGS